jgi:hypothetical protein
VDERKISQNPYRGLQRLSVATVQARGRNYRNLTVASALLALALVISLIVSRRVEVLLGSLAMLPLASFFLLLDERIVRTWRKSVLKAWTEERIDLGHLRALVLAVPGLPRPTIEGMFLTAGYRAEDVQPDDSPAGLREAISCAIDALSFVDFLRLSVFSASSAAAVALLLFSVGLQSWRPLLGLGLVGVGLMAYLWGAWKVLARSGQRLRYLAGDVKERGKLVTLLERSNLGSTPRHRERLIRSITGPD